MAHIYRFSSYLSVIVVLAIATSCGGKKYEDNLKGKKEQLADLKAESAKKLEEIEKLKKEIEKLDSVKIQKSVQVAIAPVTVGTFEHFVDGTGRLEAENNVWVSPQMGGAITKVYVKIGDFISKGQKIASIDNTIMVNSIQEVEIQLATAKDLLARQKALWDQKIGTEVQYIQAKTNVESLEKRIATLQSQSSYSIVYAPLSGMVDEIRFKVGEMAAPGLGIVRIINMNELKIVASIPDTYAGTISNGAMMKVTLPDVNKEINTKIRYVSQTINPITRTFTVEAGIPMVDKNLKPNLNANIKINDKTRTGAITILQNLVQNTEQGSIVYIAEDLGGKKVARSRKVQLGQTYNGRVEILSGLNASDQLIVEGYQEVVDDQLINY
ncbi:MAG: efflux RND transporter periplasmic adaptor subunit [Leadbetterella sp.]